jgi:hypothetical protein
LDSRNQDGQDLGLPKTSCSDFNSTTSQETKLEKQGKKMDISVQYSNSCLAEESPVE